MIKLFKWVQTTFFIDNNYRYLLMEDGNFELDFGEDIAEYYDKQNEHICIPMYRMISNLDTEKYSDDIKQARLDYWKATNTSFNKLYSTMTPAESVEEFRMFDLLCAEKFSMTIEDFLPLPSSS